MRNKSVSSSNFSLLMIFLPIVLTMLISAGGVEIWPIDIFFLIILILVYHCILLPAGAFVKYQLNAEKIEIISVFTNKKKVYSLADDIYLYIYPSLVPHLVISKEIISSKQEAKKKIRCQEVGCVTLWGEFRSALSSYEKRATKLK